MFTGRPERLRGFPYTGYQQYFLTFCTFERRLYFASPPIVATTLSEILRAGDHEQFAFIAYCFMPDHLHLLIDGRRDDADARSFIARAKQFSGFRFSREHDRARLWQRYGYERVLRRDDDTLAIARYILENPVRAGLTSDASSYPFSGSTTCPIACILDAMAWAPRDRR